MSLCDRCRKTQATFHMTLIEQVSGEKSSRDLCEKCAVEEGLLQTQKIAAPEGALLEQFVEGAAKVADLQHLTCEECGTTYLEFRNQGPLGCPHDYDVFKPGLHALIERAHDGGALHVGKTPRHAASAPRITEQDLTRLRRQLEDAVAAEDYKRAAGLRDRILELESQ